MRSRLYTGRVSHKRSAVASNAFSYPVYYLGVDLDELDELDAGLRRFSHNHAGLVSLWDRDHGPRDGSPLRPWIDALAATAGIDLTGGRVMLLTFPRVLGARFYPVSFWYLYGADGDSRGVLAEVHNTYGDRHNYLLHNHGEPYDWSSRPRATKAFFVSPFIQREGVEYEFAFSSPAEKLVATLRDYVEGELTLTASIALTPRELTDAALLSTVLRHGPISVVALIRIHWQALKLFSKRVPLQPHTPPPAQETSL